MGKGSCPGGRISLVRRPLRRSSGHPGRDLPGSDPPAPARRVAAKGYGIAECDHDGEHATTADMACGYLSLGRAHTDTSTGAQPVRAGQAPGPVAPRWNPVPGALSPTRRRLIKTDDIPRFQNRSCGVDEA